MQLHQCNVLIGISCTLLILYASCVTATGAERESAETKTQATTTIESGKRPKIGLVLSGGGARGFAHIGVLKVLEENNVPVDYVVGTSMGSIIAGLYAIGLTPEEIERGVNGIDWDKVFNDFAYRDYKSYRRKNDDYEFFNMYRVGITKTGLQISPGLIEGQQIEIALDRLAYPGFTEQDFDRFRIPYRAIATDIETGEAVIIKNGNLARAMRASMSIPGALPPITIDGRLLVDGGIGNNVPIEVVRDMGADIVIVVDVGAPLATKDELKSSIDITAQLTTILTRRIADTQIQTLQDRDVLIIPGDIEISSSDFVKYAELIASGETAAHGQLESIKQLSLSYDDYATHLASLPDIADKKPVINFIEINNSTALRDDVLRVRIHQQIGEPLDVLQLERDLAYIYGLDYSGSVVYTIEDRDGATGLIIYARDRPWARSYLQFGLSLENVVEVQSISNFFVSYNKTDLNDLAGELRAVAAIGSEPEAGAEFYQPLNLDLDIYVSAKAGFETMIAPTLIGDDIVSVQRFNRNYIALSAGKIFNQTSSLELGLRYNDGRISSISGLTFDDTRSSFIESYYYVQLFHDSLDNLSFPNHGLFGGISFTENRESLGADRDHQQIQVSIGGASTYKRYTVFSRAMFDTTLDEVPLPELQANSLFWRGGFLELSGTVRNELLGQHFGLLEAAFYRRLGDISFLPMYTGFSLEAGNAWLQRSDINTDNTRLAGSLFIGADSFLGPIYLAFGASDKGDTAVYLNLGASFLTD